MSRTRTPCGVCAKPSYGKKCRECHHKSRSQNFNKRDWYLRKKYGISEEEFWVYWIACHGKCFVCNKQMELPKNQRGQNLHAVCVDHNHDTGEVRGLLCGACNKGIGLLGDKPALIKRALRYLEI